MSAAVSGGNDRVNTSSHRYMLGDPPYQTQIMGDEHQREALPPQIVHLRTDDHARRSAARSG
jgi:hypothetical protein